MPRTGNSHRTDEGSLAVVRDERANGAGVVLVVVVDDVVKLVAQIVAAIGLSVHLIKKGSMFQKEEFPTYYVEGTERFCLSRALRSSRDK